MTEKRPLSEVLTRLYFWGWVGLAPLASIFGLIAYISYNWEFRYFLEGLWIGLVNLGILWTGLFLLIAIGHIIVSIIWRFIEPGNQRRDQVVRPFCEEFREVCGFGWMILIVIGFISEFLAESYGLSGGLLAVIAFGFLPVTVLAVLLAYIRCRA
jgi:magnesium-transporting ATPase (P-type)